jgi:transposase
VGYFAGLDVSLEETAICIVDDAGKIVREARAASEPEALVTFFTECGMTMERVGLEACSLTAWLYADSNEGGHQFQSDRGHHSNLMAASLVSSLGPVLVMS